MVTALATDLLDRVCSELDSVVDPEIPVLTIADLGVLRATSPSRKAGWW